MTDETDETTETETTVAAEPEPSGDEDAAESNEEVEEDDDDDDDDDDDEKSKASKPKKAKISYDAAMPRNEAVSYFEAIVGGLRSGRLEFRQEGETLILNPTDHLEIEVKAQRKGEKAKVTFEIAWTDQGRQLEILN